MFDPIFYPGRYPTGKIFLTHGLARAKPGHLVGPTCYDPRKKKNPSKKPFKKKPLKTSRATALARGEENSYASAVIRQEREGE